MDYCYANEISMTYKGYSSNNFHRNLEFFGADFPEFYANLVRMYVARDAKTRVLSELVTISSGNSQESKVRQYQMKSFLRAVALGLVPGSIWDGKLSTYGGYIVVKESGEILALHLANDDDFRDYLFENTVLTTPKSELFLRTAYVEGLAQVAFNAQLRFIK
jgi:type II restriction enzyme